MKEDVLKHITSLLTGVIHNLNTPLMWIMGRSQLLETRNKTLDKQESMLKNELTQVKEKNQNDLDSIIEGVVRIEDIIKALSYKLQHCEEGKMTLELRELLHYEIEFLNADMQFKHETKVHFPFDELKQYYVSVDYNLLSLSLTGLVYFFMKTTPKGRKINFSLNQGEISVSCPEAILDDEKEILLRKTLSSLIDVAEIKIDGDNGTEVRIKIREH